MPRVQVQELAPADRLQVAPLQGDTFAAPAQAPIDNDMERLSSALGFFNSKLSGFIDHNQAKADKALKEKHLAEWEQWKGARTNSQQLEEIRQGKAPYWSDPIIGEVIKRDYAGLEAERFADDLDRDILDGKIEKLGKPRFDPDAYVLERSKEYQERVGRDPSATIAFGGALEKIKRGFKSKHEEYLGQTQTASIENAARNQINAVVETAIDNDLDTDVIMDVVRDTYKDLGPRVKGGSLDLKYGRMDEIFLDVLQHKAGDPRYAKQVLTMLDTQRKGIDGRTNIGRLKDIGRHSDAIAGIEKVAVKALADQSEENIKQGVLQMDKEALKQNDGTFSTITDASVPNPWDKSRQIKVTASGRKQEAIKEFIADTRAANGGKPDFDGEFDTMFKNGVKHPEWIPLLESTLVAANTNVSKDGSAGPEQIDRIIKSANLYNDIADRNRTYLTSSETGVTKPVQDFFETYTTLVRYGGRTPEQAAAEVARAWSNDVTQQDPQVTATRFRLIEEAASRIDYNGWWPGGGASNSYDLKNNVVKVAEGLMRVEGISPDMAIKHAQERVRLSSVMVNGRAVMGPGIKQGDEPWVQKSLDDAFAQNSALFKTKGIDDANYLSLAPYRNGQFLVVKWDGGAITVPASRDADGKPIGLKPVVVTQADIATHREKGEKELKAEATQESVRRNAASKYVAEKDDEFVEFLRRNIVDPWKIEDLKK